MNLTISFVIFRNDENLVYQKFQEYLQSNHIYLRLHNWKQNSSGKDANVTYLTNGINQSHLLNMQSLLIK